MIQTFALFPGITLRCFRSDRFKQGFLSVQLVRPMAREEAAANALIPAVLLRGTQEYRDLRDITLRLDDLYGASVSALVRRIGDLQTTGLSCAFMEDRFAMEGDRVLAPMTEFLGQLLLNPVTEDGGFSREYTQSEQRNLILTMESELNDKRAYAASQLLRHMCREDSFGIPRLGEKEQVRKLDHRSLYAHYRKILRESPIELFYVGSAAPDHVAALLTPLLAGLERDLIPQKEQTAYRDSGEAHRTETMDVTQAKLSMGFVTPITNQDPRFGAMQVMNAVFGGGMTSKLFMNVREKLSLCYSVGSGYYGSKGIMTVHAGIDADQEALTREQILAQLDACRRGQLTQQELQAGKEAILSGLRGLHDSPGAIENYYATTSLSGFAMTLEQYRQTVERVDRAQVMAAAQTLRYHSSFFLKGGPADA